jgi:hypothetical protein
MQGPETNPVADNFPQSTLKRKGVTSKALAHKTKRMIKSVVVDASDMARVSASAFKVLTFTLFPFPFVFFN